MLSGGGGGGSGSHMTGISLVERQVREGLIKRGTFSKYLKEVRDKFI